MTVKLARKKPTLVEVVKWDGGNMIELKEFMGEYFLGYRVISDASWQDGKVIPFVEISIRTIDSVAKAVNGDYIIKGVNGEFYPCKQDIFEKTYDLVEETPKRYVFNPTPEDMDKANELGDKINAEVVRLIDKYSVEDISIAFEGLELGDE